MNKNNVPLHLALIPDGNRRWAKTEGFEAGYGHIKVGDYEHLRELILGAKQFGVKYLSLWAFSTENWARAKKERDTIFDMILNSVEKFREDASENKLRFRHIGRKDRLPDRVVSEISKLEKETENYNGFNVLLCLDYGGRDEIIRSVNKIIASGIKSVDENKFSEFLDTFGIPDVDLIIRTAGDYRLSGFMPFQSAYSEFYFPKINFPDFNKQKLAKAIEEFARRKRNFGR